MSTMDGPGKDESVQGNGRELTFGEVVDALCRNTEALGRRGRDDQGRLVLPSRDAVLEAVEALRTVLFPGYFGMPDLHEESLHYYVGSTLDRALHLLEEQVRRGLCFAGRYPFGCEHGAARARTVIRTFLSRLPRVRRLLASDVQAAFIGDPALHSPDEAILCYPGMLAITNARIAHELFELEVPLIPRIITEDAHSLTGIDIHPGARIDEQFFIDHGTGVVIGETCVIGKRVRIYQGVTLGAKSFPLDQHGRPIKGVDRHPVVEDDVVIYAGATILGRITLGRGSKIGGNVWVTASVPPGSRVTQSIVQLGDYDGGGGI